METKKLILDELLKLPSPKSIGLMETLSDLKDYTKDLQMLFDENSNRYYFYVPLKDLINEDTDIDFLTSLYNANWQYSKDGKGLVNYF